MASSINKAILMGRVGQDPELRYNGQLAVCKFNLATSKSWIDKKTNERRENVNWHRITIMGSRAETINKWLVKGSFVYIEGEIRNSSYEKEGKKFYVSEIICNDLKFLDNKEQSEKLRKNSKKPNENESQNSSSQHEEPLENFESQSGDDEIPF